jgi:hypothetical protein
MPILQNRKCAQEHNTPRISQGTQGQARKKNPKHAAVHGARSPPALCCVRVPSQSPRSLSPAKKPINRTTIHQSSAQNSQISKIVNLIEHSSRQRRDLIIVEKPARQSTRYRRERVSPETQTHMHVCDHICTCKHIHTHTMLSQKNQAAQGKQSRTPHSPHSLPSPIPPQHMTA